MVLGPVRSLEGVDACSAARPDPHLRVLAAIGGGGYFELNGTADLDTTFARVADELHRQYLLAYVAPEHDGVLHHLEVRVRRPDVTVRARTGYVAPR
jgi:Ca-activated chloride channel family protein